MRRKIFLDVGGHRGETLREINEDNYLFDIIHSFEPKAEPYQTLKQYENKEGKKQIFCHQFGLADFTGKEKIYGRDEGASMFLDKADIDNSIVEEVEFVSASEFFKTHLKQEDLIVMKLNCEGGEIPILENLLESGEIFKIDNVMIDFDARKIESQHKKPKEVMRRLKKAGFFNYCLQQAVISKTLGFRNWLGGLSFASEIMQNTLTPKERLKSILRKRKGFYPLRLRRRHNYAHLHEGRT